MRVTRLLDEFVDALNELPSSSENDPGPDVLVLHGDVVGQPLAVERRVDVQAGTTYLCLIVETGAVTSDYLLTQDELRDAAERVIRRDS